MDEIVRSFNAGGVRYLLIGGQAIRLLGMPRYSMDWDFYIPPRDEANVARINTLLEAELDVPLLTLGPRGENFIQTYHTAHGVLQFHLIGPGFPRFDEAEARAAVISTEHGTPVKCLSPQDMLQAKRASGRPRDEGDIEFLELLLPRL